MTVKKIIGLFAVLLALKIACDAWIFGSWTDKNSVNQAANIKMLENMKLDVLGDKTLQTLKESHDKVTKAIYSIPPAKREKFETHPIITVSKNNVDKAGRLLKKRITKDLKINRLPHALEKQIDSLLEWTDVANSMKDDYVSIDISGEYGGTSTIRLGMLKFDKINENEVLLAISLYCEEWTEQERVKINTKSQAWSDENIKNFLKYEMIDRLKGQIASEKAQLRIKNEL